MNEIEITSPAKVNLFFEILGKRKDGYFQIETILQEIDLHDDVLIRNIEGGDIHVEVSPPLSIAREDNLAYRAAKLIQQKAKNFSRGAEIFIKKKIPVGRGLGGGSSNASSVLKGLNKLWQLGFSTKELADLGKELGMDVPFFIYGGTCLGTERGEVIKPLPRFSGFKVVIVWPDFSLSTAEVYKKIPINLTKRRRSAKFLIDSLKTKDFEGVTKHIFNRLQDVALEIYPPLSEFKKKLAYLTPFDSSLASRPASQRGERSRGSSARQGMDNIIMSGSGSAFFTILPKSWKKEKDILKRLTKLKASLPPTEESWQGGYYIGKTL